LGQDFQATLWIGLDWIHELMDWIGLGQQKWAHVQLWADSIAGMKHKLCRLVGRHLVADCMQLLLSLHSMQLSLTAMSNDCMEFMRLQPHAHADA